jgi:deoxyribodipyrimidine photolyase-related protein
MTECRIRNLVIVLGGQLDETSSAFAEVSEESEPVWSAKQRIAVFLSAMHPLHTTFGRGIGL